MPNIVTRTILSEGTKKSIVHFYIESDGNEGELVNRVILDPTTDFAVPVPPQYNTDDGVKRLVPPQLTVLQFWGSCAWFDLTFAYGGSTSIPSFVVGRDSDFYLDFRGFGGVKDQVTVDPNGQILLSTRDFAPAGSNGFFVLELKKD